MLSNISRAPAWVPGKADEIIRQASLCTFVSFLTRYFLLRPPDQDKYAYNMIGRIMAVYIHFIRDGFIPHVLPAICLHYINAVVVRGGVENTRLEAKAKDTKNIRGQGQGQPFRGQTLSRPRTGMLEAKAKDQGHRRKCSPKKKGLQNFIFRRSPKEENKKSLRKFSARFLAFFYRFLKTNKSLL